jgi:GTP-binding protein Era
MILRRTYFAIKDGYVSGLKRALPPPVRKAGRRIVPKTGRLPTHVPKEQEILPEVVREEVVRESWTSPDGSLVCRAALVGLANAGKSTLLNALLGVHVAAVSDRPHTTRVSSLGKERNSMFFIFFFFYFQGSVVGAVTRGLRQAVLVDTAGVVMKQEAKLRQRSLVRNPWQVLEQCQVGLLVVDATTIHEWRLPELVERLEPHKEKVRFCISVSLFLIRFAQLVVVLNKIDAVEEGSELLEALDTLRELGLQPDDALLVSAKQKTHLEDVRDTMLRRCVPGPWEVNPASCTDASDRWRVYEAVRQGKEGL